MLSYSLLLPRSCNDRRAREFHWPAATSEDKRATARSTTQRTEFGGPRAFLRHGQNRGPPAERLGFVRLLWSEDQMARVWNTPIFAIATVYFTVDALFPAVTGPIIAWLSRKRLLGAG
ncbi:hypothetical protein WN73_18075 [Bradyrhizobium sp. CCBAU 45394]|nr:hypothetical protein [Bradyrhizobium sp. CCBAU 45394]MDA9534822.1 hypothetical protein [Bradyrhizobium sp. CCBAU 21362]